MKKLLKPANIAFYFLMLLVFFAIGLYIAGIIGAGKNQGLAGGAIVLGYGVLVGGIGFISSFFIAYHVKHKLIVRLNWILLLLLIIAYGITHYRYLERQDQQESPSDLNKKPTTENKTEPTAMFYNPVTKKIITEEEKIGIGFFIPNFYEKSTLYLYGGVNLEKGLTEHTPQDSIVFTLDENQNFTTRYAPPYLIPAQLKLDYGVLHFKALGIGHDFIKIETNASETRVAYVDKNSGTFQAWPEYILSMNSVEFIEPSTQTVRVKPLDYAGEVNAAFDFIAPLLVEGDWLYGILLTDNRTETGKGWIRWRKDGNLLITYSLFS